MAGIELITARQNLSPHSLSAEEVCRQLDSDSKGLTGDEAQKRLLQFGPNKLPRQKTSSLANIFFRQFVNPLIYILLFAAALSVFIGEWIDASFIVGVLIVNAVIGTIQEFQAQRSAEALEQLVSLDAVSIRDQFPEKLKAELLVPGDIVLIESGNKIPADLRIIQEQDLALDESLLTGESLSNKKDCESSWPINTPVADRSNMLFGGTLVLRGRARGVVTATGEDTELGRIATDVQSAEKAIPPLMQRMKRFTTWVGITYLVVISLLGLAAWIQGEPLLVILMIAVALAVAAIPEGLPVAITVALAVGMSRMAKSNVIIRRLVAAETLGSCTLIAADKTGTLTVNQLTVRCVQFPSFEPWMVSGEGSDMDGKINVPEQLAKESKEFVTRLARSSVLCNEGNVFKQKGSWNHRGDSVDVALLVMAWKAGFAQERLLQNYPLKSYIPFESERLFSASLNKKDNTTSHLSAKGAVERILPMCNRMASRDGDVSIDVDLITRQAEALAEKGYRVLAIADGEKATDDSPLSDKALTKLCFVGLVGMIDPPRPEAKQAIEECHRAGVSVVMVTGDHPVTALAIARQLGLVEEKEKVVTGTELTEASHRSVRDFENLVNTARIFARIDPHQKLEIVNALRKAGHFVAVTGDGANDAPALQVAHVGVAMGKRGTDVARESSEIIITDDNFASMVSGIREGRIAYANVRKVIFLLISTGAVEIVVFILALSAGLPIPLTAIQLLWLNLVTEGIQHVGLAFEPGEGDEMKHPPRSPKEPIFNRLMIERVLISATTMGLLAFLIFWYQYSVLGVSLESARNITLLFLVMFENIQVFNSRSETRSIFRQPFFRNQLLLIGTFAAQAIHIAALYTPGLNDLLDAQPVTLNQWFLLMATALSMLLMMELHKLSWAKRYG